jgi:acyl carrier protein
VSERKTIRELVIEFIGGESAAEAASLANLNDETNLLEDGFLDSFGFVDLLNHLSEKTGVPVDPAEADPAELATLDGLARYYQK